MAFAAHDPEFSWDDDDDDSDETDGDDSTLETPSDSSPDLAHADPRLYSSPSVNGASHPDAPVRGKSLLIEKEYAALTSDVLDLALDGIDAVDDAVLRAQVGEDGAAAGDETFQDSKTVDGEKSAETRLETLVKEFGAWSDDSEVFVEGVSEGRRCTGDSQLMFCFTGAGCSLPWSSRQGILRWSTLVIAAFADSGLRHKGLLALTNRRFFICATFHRAVLALVSHA